MLGKAQEAKQEIAGPTNAPLNGPGRTGLLEIPAIEPAPRATGNAALARRVTGPAA